MSKLIFRAASIVLLTSFMSACNITVSEKHEPTEKEICKGLKRSIRYQQQNPNTEAKWNANTNRQKYYEQYQKHRCDEVLR